jgi:hypothetical protein
MDGEYLAYLKKQDEQDEADREEEERWRRENFGEDGEAGPPEIRADADCLPVDRSREPRRDSAVERLKQDVAAGKLDSEEAQRAAAKRLERSARRRDDEHYKHKDTSEGLQVRGDAGAVTREIFGDFSNDRTGADGDFRGVIVHDGTPPVGPPPQGTTDPAEAKRLLAERCRSTVEELRGCLGRGKPTAESKQLKTELAAVVSDILRGGFATSAALAGALGCNESTIRRLRARGDQVGG